MGKEWDLFDIFDACEDDYTNMLHFFYEIDDKFKYNFLKLIFDGEEVIKDVDFDTRTVYRRENNGKNIPDIILHNKNHFAIIEVKMFSDEGEKQTNRYYENRENIKKQLHIDNTNLNERYLFLTINGIKPECDAFKALTWSDVSACMDPDKCNDDMAKMLMSQFKKRILSTSLDYKIDLDALWVTQVHSYLWSGAIRFYLALKLIFDELSKINNIEWNGEYWTGFNQASNSYEHSATFYPKDGRWQGLVLSDAEDYEDCYDYHFEFKWNEENNSLTMRLDYHLNPYISAKDIERIEDYNLKVFAKKCNEFRAEKARGHREDWRNCYNKYSDFYNGRITSTIMTLVTVKYAHDEMENLTVKEVHELIRPFIKAGTSFIIEYFLPHEITMG